MPSGNSSDVKFEIGHVLFIDIVGYSKLMINEQTEQIQTLRTIVRGTEQFRLAEAENKLLRLPTGDGGALVFRNSPEAPVICALELDKELKKHAELRVRMGIHSGPVNEVTDLNEQANIAGAGVNIAQRVMDCGDAGHILLSKHVADDLEQYPQWRSHLHDLGECEVKHGARLHLFNLYTDEIGNPALPAKFRRTKEGQTSSGTSASEKRVSVSRGLIAALIILAIVAAALFYFISHRIPAKSPAYSKTAAAAAIPEKSIAVLPFENLSSDKENAYFADGVQDEILTDLAKIADLKVISRSSVMQYRSGVARNLREIGKQLGVSHLLEGSVQRAAGKVRVNAQLIDARTDAHLWAQTYDRDLADIFAIQSDIARSIAEQLQARLAPEEKNRLAAKPTENAEAYLLYLQANEVLRLAASKQEVVDADKLYARAIELDPRFALASARASMLNSLMYFVGRAPERKTRARTLADEALRLAPDLGEAHLALALCYYRIDSDFAAALKELKLASVSLPNDSEIFDFSGYIYRRQGRWRDALAVFSQARELDPRQAHFDGAATLLELRQWEAAEAAYQKGLQLEPEQVDGWYGLAYAQFARTGKPAVAAATLAQLAPALQAKPDIKTARWNYAMLERDFDAAEKLPNDNPDEFPTFETPQFYHACIAFARGDLATARRLMEETTPLHEAAVREHPDDPKFHAMLGRVYLLQGRKDDALREARKAVELSPESKDAVYGPLYLTNLAFVYAHIGEADSAITLISRLLTTPAADRITLAHLRLSWEWDPLRKHPRFQKILEGPEPVTIYH